ncbi:protein translocase subunit SecD [Candidatus Latescibacterota bacterium]
MARKISQHRISTKQKYSLVWKFLFITALVVFSFWQLYPSYQYYTMPSRERQEMDPGDYEQLRSRALNLGLDLQGGIHLVMQVDTDGMISSDAADAVDRAMTVIANRVDQFGLTEPIVQRQGENRIIIELPGMEDVERAKNLIGQTAQLEFKLLKRDEEIKFVTDRIDLYISGEEITPDSTAAADSTGTGLFEEPIEDIESTRFTSLLRYQTWGEGVPSFDMLVAQEDVPRINVYLNDPGVQKILSDNRAMMLWGPENARSDGYRALFLVNDANEMTGEMVRDARVVMGSGIDAGRPEISLQNTADGVRDWARISGSNIGRRLGIVLDGIIHSSPRFMSRIYDGSSSISGSFTQEEARDLAIVLRAGALPASVSILEDRTVGPSLGADSVRASRTALIVGLSLVVVFMLAYYFFAGIIAVIALALTMLFILCYLAYFRATLTLPGIAGIILTIGMAVDANVLIFERVREELRAGNSIRMAIENGFLRARWTILDSNITTILTAIILYNFGTGPIRGFALTLMVGIVASVFSALFISRAIFDFLVTRVNLTDRTFGVMKLFTGAKVKFVDIRRRAFVLSGAMILAGIVSLAIHGGPKYSIDFLGGSMFELHFEQPVTIAEIRDALGEVNVPGTELATSEIKFIGTDNRDVLIRIVQVENMEETSERVKTVLSSRFADRLPADLNDWLLREEQVGPSIGTELKSQALWAILFSLIVLIFYITIRFEFKYSIGAIVAIVHDVLITVGIFSLLNKEISLSIVAAILTIVGYSLNDTIVVYDRIRERLRKGLKGDYQDSLNISVNETLTRTAVTSFTTILTVMALFLFGGAVIHDFSFAMLIGVVVGTYSSIFVATPVLAEWYLAVEKKRAEAKKARK